MEETKTPATPAAPETPAPNPPEPEQTLPEQELTGAAPAQTEDNQNTPRRRKLYAEHILAIMALVLLVVNGILIALCYPMIGMEEDPELVISSRPQPTIPQETDPPADPQVPTEPVPQPEKNPYGKLDFQYEGRYLGCIKADTIPGVDVSYYQGNIDWQQVKDSGIQFAIIRLGYRGYGKEGKMVEDKNFHKNIQGALKAGLDVGVYFFSQAITVEEAQEEAEFVLQRIKNYDLTMPVVYDWEYVSDEARTANMDRRTLTDCYLAFCGQVEEAGYTPMPYFNTYQSRDLMNLVELEEYPFWLALYSSRMTFPYRIEMWQYTDSGKVPGIEGNVDLNMFFVEE